MKQELAPRGVGIPVLQGREDVKQVSYDEPMKYSEEPLAKMERAE